MISTGQLPQIVETGQRSCRILCYGDSNTFGWIPHPGISPTSRLPSDQRWPGVMLARLGKGLEVAVDGLSNRTTDVDLIDEHFGLLANADFNGLKGLPLAVAREMPLDIVIIMLGTNDLRANLGRSAERIAAGAVAVAKCVRECVGGVETIYPAPQPIVIAPPPLGQISPMLADDLKGGGDKSAGFGGAFLKACKQGGVLLFDAGQATATSGVDGVHLTADDHQRLGQAIADFISRMWRYGTKK